MNYIFVEENGKYEFDCTAASWASNEMHKDYQAAKIELKDADFLIEDDSQMLLMIVEYKNAMIPEAENPNAFQPLSDKKVKDVSQKFYDSLHYLKLLGKDKPVSYVYVVEFPDGDEIMRKRLRNKLKPKLPFELQNAVGNGRKLIDRFDVVSIQEWNENPIYGRYPIRLAKEN